MGTPAPTTILTEIGLRLANITTGNGYNFTVKKVARSRLEPFDGYDLPCVNYWSTGFFNARNEYGKDTRTLDVYVEIHSLTRDEPFIDVANRLAMDVVTVLMRTDAAPKVSDTPNYELNETVADLSLDSVDYEVGEGQKPWCGALLKFTIKYTCDSFDMDSYGV